MSIKKIFIIGAGYVGLANGLALAKSFKVIFIDNDQKKLDIINGGHSPIKEDDLNIAIKNYSHNIRTSNSIKSIEDESLVILSLPTNYDEELESFDTSVIDSIVQEISDLKKKVMIVIKSTVPIGYTGKLIAKNPQASIYFSPEFLREGKSFEDATNPERIIISPIDDNTETVSKVLCSAAINFDKNDVHMMNTDEAESVKLFSNSYLAMRVAFINEIDTFCEEKKLNPINVINGICKDSRIGKGYNNPSFGYGGYCFPKDIKQTQNAFKNIPESIISAVIESNDNRAVFIARKILKTKKKVIGFYRLNMKAGSDNIRNSSSVKVLKILLDYDVKIIVYESLNVDKSDLQNSKVSFTNDFEIFSNKSEIIVANRLTKEIEALDNKIYTRDIFYEN